MMTALCTMLAYVWYDGHARVHCLLALHSAQHTYQAAVRLSALSSDTLCPVVRYLETFSLLLQHPFVCSVLGGQVTESNILYSLFLMPYSCELLS